MLFDLTVEENLFLGKEIKKGFGICDRKAMRAKAEETLKRLGVSIPTDKVMSELSVGQGFINYGVPGVCTCSLRTKHNETKSVGLF